MNEQPITEDEILTHIGVLLLNVQHFEFLLTAALKQIYAPAEDLTPEKIFAGEKRTLGMLMSELRKRTTLEHDADALLAAVLKDRNVFVHHLSQRIGFDISSDIGRDRLWEFLGPFTLNLNRLIHLFVAIHIKHGDEIGFDSADVRQIKTDPGWKIDAYYPQAGKIRKKT
ncbi:MAG: hypothetical protein V4773_04665 [Verrucomicrobiota bacterium]